MRRWTNVIEYEKTWTWTTSWMVQILYLLEILIQHLFFGIHFFFKLDGNMNKLNDPFTCKGKSFLTNGASQDLVLLTTQRRLRRMRSSTT